MVTLNQHIQPGLTCSYDHLNQVETGLNLEIITELQSSRVELSLWLQKQVAVFNEYITCIEDNYHSMNTIM